MIKKQLRTLVHQFFDGLGVCNLEKMSNRKMNVFQKWSCEWYCSSSYFSWKFHLRSVVEDVLTHSQSGVRWHRLLLWLHHWGVKRLWAAQFHGFFILAQHGRYNFGNIRDIRWISMHVCIFHVFVSKLISKKFKNHLIPLQNSRTQTINRSKIDRISRKHFLRALVNPNMFHIVTKPKQD